MVTAFSGRLVAAGDASGENCKDWMRMTADSF